jgi:hypothetical protein
LTSGKSLPERTSPIRRFLAVLAVDSVCVVLLYWAGFNDAMTGWAGDYAKPHPPVHLVPWTVLAMGFAFAIHAVYAYRRTWNPEAVLQGICGIVAIAIGFGMLSSTHDGAAQQPTPARNTQTNSNYGNFCYSGGDCYINGQPVSGHP